MSKANSIVIAGFGGQGVLFMGKLLAYAGMMADKEVSWMPSYGPEMRGGTCNCSINISDDPIGAPIITTPTELVAMNLPSLDKFESAVVPGGKVFIDSSLIERKVTRDDVTVCYIPATRIASDNGFPKLANMILLGRMLKETGVFDLPMMEKVMEKELAGKKKDLIPVNLKALELGYNYQE